MLLSRFILLSCLFPVIFFVGCALDINSEIESQQGGSGTVAEQLDTNLDSKASLPPVREHHAWLSGPLVVMFYIDPGFFDVRETQLPEVLIYADGRVMVKKETGLMEGQISRTDLCSLLYTIEQTNFFAYSQSDYDVPTMTDQSTTFIEINGWAHNSVQAYALNSFEEDGRTKEVEELLETIEILKAVKAEDVVPFIPEKIALLVLESNRTSVDDLQNIREWPIDTISLEAIKGEQEFWWAESLLEGENAGLVYDLLTIDGPDSYPSHYKEGDKIYLVHFRSILPYQIPDEHSSWLWFPQFDSSKEFEMSCP